jgi:hypothetical protein
MVLFIGMILCLTVVWAVADEIGYDASTATAGNHSGYGGGSSHRFTANEDLELTGLGTYVLTQTLSRTITVQLFDVSAEINATGSGLLATAVFDSSTGPGSFVSSPEGTNVYLHSKSLANSVSLTAGKDYAVAAWGYNYDGVHEYLNRAGGVSGTPIGETISPRITHVSSYWDTKPIGQMPIANPEGSVVQELGPTMIFSTSPPLGVVIDPGDLDVVEGYSADYEISLESAPSANVQVTVEAISEAPRISISSGAVTGTPGESITLNFSDSDWNVPQIVTLTVTDDQILQGPVETQIRHQGISTDPFYNEKSKNLDLTINDDEAGLEDVDLYNVYWNSPSTDSSGSMPLGNGDIGINLWAQENDDLIFYISKTDAWDDSGRLCKIGKLRVNISSNPFQAGKTFYQALRLGSGDIIITADTGGNTIALKVWVDANRPVIHIQSNSQQAVTMSADLELWRTAERTLDGSVGHNNDETTVSDMYSNLTGPDLYPTVVYPDTVLTGQSDRIAWYHHNQHSGWQFSLQKQNLDDAISQLGLVDPLQNRIWGAVVKGDGFTNTSDTALTSQSGTNHSLQVHVLTDTQSSPSQWLSTMNSQIVDVELVPVETAYQDHLQWWRQFWQRSWIHLDSDSSQMAASASVVSKGYARQRFLEACAGRGAYPIKFNGSLFTIEYKKMDFVDPDYRRWGPGYWMQNTRLTYWSKLMSGDWDILQPFFELYLAAQPLREYSSQHYYGHGGAWYPETFWFFGTMPTDVYGWNRSGKAIGWIEEPYTRYDIQNGMELSTIMLDYYAYSGDEQFLRQKALPLIDSLLLYYMEHFKYERDSQNNQIGFTENYDAEGKLLMYPLNSLEMYWGVTNGTPDVAGIRKNINVLQSLDSSLTTQAQRDFYAEVASRVPDLPLRQVSGQTAIGFADPPIPGTSNLQNPELQAIFPYRLFGVGKDQLDMAVHTFNNRVIDQTGGWHQDAIHAAMVGLAETAKTDVVSNFSTPDSSKRYPGFYGPNYDWSPDQDHAGVPCIALQLMLMQCEGDVIQLFPAWPQGWDVNFKLHAPSNTTVECELKDGVVIKFLVTPASRRGNVVSQYPLPAYSPYDLDGDGETNLIDLQFFMGDWLSQNVDPNVVISDFDRNRKVDFVDWSAFGDHWLMVY